MSTIIEAEFYKSCIASSNEHDCDHESNVNNTNSNNNINACFSTHYLSFFHVMTKKAIQNGKPEQFQQVIHGLYVLGHIKTIREDTPKATHWKYNLLHSSPGR